MSKKSPEAQKHLEARTERRVDWISRHVPESGKPSENSPQIRCYFLGCTIDVWPTTGAWCVVGTKEFYTDDWHGFQIRVNEEKEQDNA